MSPRQRVLSVRLSAAEYDALKKVCALEGSRSMSDFARATILARIRSAGAQEQTLAGDLTALGAHLGEVDDAIKVLSTRIEKVLGNKKTP